MASSKGKRVAAFEDDKAAKHKRLTGFKSGLPHCSQNALSAILDKVKKEGIPESIAPKDFRAASKSLLEGMTLYGPIWQISNATTLEGNEVEIKHLNVLSFLAGLYYNGGSFQSYLDKLHSERPSSVDRPWQAILFSDEVHPGHQLSSSAKKVWAIYFAFVEYGSFLCKEDLWITLYVGKSSTVQQLRSSIGQVFKLVLESMFQNPMANPLYGVRLKKENGQCLVLHWTMAMWLQDGAAQKMTFSNKQDSGSRICMLCKNLFSAKGGGGIEKEKVLQKHIRLGDLDLSSSGEILESWQRMKERQANLNKGQFKKWMQATGIDFTHEALLLSAPLKELQLLKPVEQYVPDLMHALCSKGCLSYVTFWVLEALCEGGMADIYERLQSYLQLWRQPKALSTFKAHLLFDKKAVDGHKSAGYIKSSASEMLALHKPLAYFIQSCCLANNFMVDQCKCFLNWSAVLEYCMCIPFLQRPSPEHVLHLVETALESIVTCGWGPEMRPKMHWPLHWPHCLKRFGILPSCWSLERKHKVVRRQGSLCFNIEHYEMSVLREVLCDQVAALHSTEDLVLGCCLQNPKANKKAQAILAQYNIECQQVARSCKLSNGFEVAVEDMVLFQSSVSLPMRCGKVCYLLASNGYLLALVEEYQLAESNKEMLFSKWEASAATLCLVEVKCIRTAVTYSVSSNVGLVVLEPYHVAKGT